MVTADFNGDGIPDVAMAGAASSLIVVSLGNGDGTFRQSAGYSTPGRCAVGTLAVGDFNNDQKPDLLVVCEAGSQVFVYAGHGDGTFGNAVSTEVAEAPVSGILFLASVTQVMGAVVGDFNGDGVLDLILPLISDPSKLTTPGAYILLGNGDGTFQIARPVSFTLGTLALATGDFNGDHVMDLAVLTTPELDLSGALPGETLTVLLGNGDGSFRKGKSYPWTGPTFSLTAVDLNGDGNLDLYGAGLNLSTKSTVLTSSILVMLGDGKGNFQAGFSANEPVNDAVTGYCLGSFVGTGTVDLMEMIVEPMSSSNSVALSLGLRPGDGMGGFQSLVTLPGPSDVFPFALNCADYNGDGLADVAFTGITYPGFVRVSTANGSPSYANFANIIQALPSGTFYVDLNTTSIMLTFANVNGASFAQGPVATNSIVSAFWNGPVNPKGIGVNVTDSAGTTRAAQIFYLASKQINYAIPSGTATGNATITITGTPDTFTAQQQIVAVAPGVFNAGGLAVGGTLTVHNGQQTPGVIVQPDSSGKLQLVPINVGSGSDQVFLLLYGTGIRNHAMAVTATAGTTAAQVAYAGAQGMFLDEDQINVLLPQSLSGAGVVNVVLNVDGQMTNPVQILIQ